ncbi:MAG: GIY-YIG nuclease family protein [Spirochaetota bacterium]|nr:GIY-YIG nuclease family protein [Spirochaetota bacterium]
MKRSNYYWIYILECENGCYYTGYTENLFRRYLQHINGSAKAKYTRSFKPTRIAQCWKLYDTKGIALRIEHFIKSLDRKVKDIIVDDPERLKYYVLDKLTLDIEIFPYNPELVESELLNLYTCD